MSNHTGRVDAHHHLWSPGRGDYVWMRDDDPVLARRYTPAQLEPELQRCGIEKTVLVQAAPSVGETEYLLGISEGVEWVGAVTGWVDFEQSAQRDQLARFASHPKFRGVRPMIQDIADPLWMLRADLSWAYEAITHHQLAFEALGFTRHLAPFLELFQRYPDMRVIVDHGMKPDIAAHADGEINADWEVGLRAIAEQTSAYCKLSGLVTESAAQWRVDQLRPYVDVILDAFGVERVVWGSDWPVLTLRTDYGAWFEATLTLLCGLSPDERSRILGQNATAFYRLAE